MWNPGPCTPSVIVGHTSGVNFCPLVHGVAEFGSPASATLFGRFDPERRNELNRADVTEMFHDPARCEGYSDAPSIRLEMSGVAESADGNSMAGSQVFFVIADR